MKIKLTKREYVGKGYYYNFKNIETGLYSAVECTEEDYAKLALPNAINPTLEGHVFTSADGGTIKVDSPSGILELNEYTEMEGKYFVVGLDNKGNEICLPVEKEQIVNDEIDSSTFNIWR